MTSPSWASSVTRGVRLDDVERRGLRAGVGDPGDDRQVERRPREHAAVRRRQPLDERHVLGQRAPALTDLDADRVEAGPRQRQLALHLAAGRSLDVEDQGAAARRGPVLFGAKHIEQVVLGAVDRRTPAAFEDLGHLGPQRDRFERRHEERQLGIRDRRCRVVAVVVVVAPDVLGVVVSPGAAGSGRSRTVVARRRRCGRRRASSGSGRESCPRARTRGAPRRRARSRSSGPRGRA